MAAQSRSHAGCALAGDPLATAVCGRRMGWVVTAGFAHRRLQLFPVSVRVRSCPFKSVPAPPVLLSVARNRISAISSFIFSSLIIRVSEKKNRLSRGRSGAGCADAYADDRPRMCVVRWRVCGRPTAHLRSVGPVGQVGRLFHLSCSLCAIKPRLSQWSYWSYPSYCAGFLSVVRNRISAISSFIFSSLIIRVSEKKPPVPRDRR